jgi:uncharacterized protein (DUF305 family)
MKWAPGTVAEITAREQGPVGRCLMEYPTHEEGITMKRMIRLALGAAALALSTGPALAAGPHKTAANDTASGGHEMKQHMMKGMEQMHSMPMSGDMDRDFATMMRHHHQQGVKMAEMQLQKGDDPKMKEMARKIAESQRKEIKEFDAWLAKNK